MSDLNDDDIDDAHAYLRSIGHRSPLERAKASYQPMRELDEIVGLEREGKLKEPTP